MTKKFLKLQQAANSRIITEETDREFLMLLRRGLLLALHENGLVSQQQLWMAEEKLGNRGEERG